MKLIIPIVLALMLATSPVLACGYAVGQTETVSKLTYYIPAKGGTNGSCSGGKAYGNACSNTFDKFLEGSSPFVLAAVARSNTGGSDDMYGGVYRATTIEQKTGIKGCIVIGVGDVYGSGSNGKSKMDIAIGNTKEQREMAEKFNQSSGEFIPIGSLNFEGNDWENRNLERIYEAAKPLNNWE
ncbi:MAG: hypothetical protein M9962_12625 [Oligoflexia bacterium]|nr:hypothetical protein [Oligoflexia bacterium]